jgi:hypothetical protein
VRVNRRIIDDDPAWMSSIGLPNGTAVWQLGDSSEQKGSYKMAMTREKDALVLYKQRMEMPLAIQRCDVMPLIHRTVAPSFCRVDSNIKALRARGWVECNSILMDHPEVRRNAARIKAAEDRAASAAASASPIELEAPTASAAVGPEAPTTSSAAVPRVAILGGIKFNVMEGVAGTFTQDLLQHIVRKEAVHQAYIQRKEDGAEARQRLADAVQSTRSTGGVMLKSRETGCNNEILRIRRGIGQKKTGH